MSTLSGRSKLSSIVLRRASMPSWTSARMCWTPSLRVNATRQSQLLDDAHDRAIRSFALWFERPFSWQTFSSVMELLTSMRGPDLLRVKGLVNVEGERGPVVVQGVQHIFHPPVTLDAWPGEDRRSRLVFITRNIPQEAVAALFAAVGELGD